MPALTREIVRTRKAFTSLRSEWEALYFRTRPRNPFLSYAWTDACFAIGNGTAQLFIVTLRKAGRLVAVAPLALVQTAGFRALRFIADDRSDYLAFLCDPDVAGLEQEMLEHVLETNAEWDLAVLRQLTDTYTSLHRAAVSSGLASHQTEWIRAPYCRIEGEWSSFTKSGPSWFREMPKRSRRFERDGHRVERFKGLDAIARLDEVAAVEARSWKGRQQTTRLQAGGGRGLLERAFSELGTRGEMELWLAYVEKRAVAFQIDFVMDDRVWHYQCAYDEDYRHTRAGSILTYHALLDGWARGLREFDYLSGEEPYKLERTNASRLIYHRALHRRTVKGWLAYSLLIAPRWRLRKVDALKAMYKSVRSMAGRLRRRDAR